MPVSVRDWLPEDHFAWFVLEAVEQLDLSAFHAAYRDDGWGRQAYDPAMMLALLLYAYCEGERSSRRIERRCREDITYRVLSANQQPDYATICRFRQRHEQALAGLFVEALRLCAEAGLARVGVVALDGTKLRANASRERNRTQAKLEADVERMLAEAEQADAEEQADSGRQRSDALPPELRSRSQRLARLREREQKDARGRQPKRPTPDPETKVNLSDPDSRVVRDYWGHYQGYNAQAAATSEQVIVAAELTRAATDVQELEPMVETTNRNLAALGQAPIGILLADAGYYSDANVRSLAAAGPELLIASRNDRNRRAAGPARAWAHPGRALDPRADAPQADDQAWPSALRAAPLDDRTSLRPDQGEPRHPPLPAPRLPGRRQRMAVDRRHAQLAQALPPHSAPRLAGALRPPLTQTAHAASPRPLVQPGPTPPRPRPMSTSPREPTTPLRLTATPGPTTNSVQQALLGTF